MVREEQDTASWKFAMQSWGYLGGGKRADGFEGLPKKLYPAKVGGMWACSTRFETCNFETADQMAMFDHLASEHLKHFSICAWCGVVASESRRYLRQHLVECFDQLMEEVPWSDLAASSR